MPLDCFVRHMQRTAGCMLCVKLTACVFGHESCNLVAEPVISAMCIEQ